VIMKEALAEREKQVLEAIILDYIQTAEPVGSRTVAKKLKMELSPATIRNVMADLEEMSLLVQPHTSAGRVPTDRAFRYYVDSLLEVRALNRFSRDRIETGLGEKLDLNEMMRRASSLLSALSKQTGVVLAPRFGSTIFKHVEFIKLQEKKVLVLIVSKMGEVQNKVIEADEAMNQDELDKYSKYLTEIMGGLTLVEAKRKITEELKKEKVLFDKLMYRALLLSQKALEDEEGGNIYIEGRTNLMQLPEFADLEKIRILLMAFEEKTKLVKLLDKALAAHGIQIFIGAENELREMRDCTVITAPYSRENYTLGTLGVIGPTRMDYCTIIPLVGYTARVVGRILEHMDS
jgi:heat-inducible transcriptional repressor